MLVRLWAEGFGNEYGLWLPERAGRRLHDRLLALPSGLDELTVFTVPDDVPIAIAGLRAERRHSDGGEQLRIAVEELGLLWTIGWALWLEVYAPPNYQPKIDEAYVYGVMVVEVWRGQGVGA